MSFFGLKQQKQTQKMDRNHDGVVTIDEFLDCCRYDKAISNSMLVFDSTIWPYDSGHFDGNSHALNSNTLMPLENRHDDRVAAIDNQNHSNYPSHHVHHKQQQQHTSNGGGSIKSSSKISHSHKSSFSKNFTHNSSSNNSRTNATTTTMHYHTTTVLGNKMRNNSGHKVSQTKRIQLSTAAKRCKSMDRANAVDNNPKAINRDDDICVATDTDDVAVVVVAGDCARTRQIIDDASVNNSSNQSTQSPTLVRVKTWYTEASIIVLPTHSAWYFDVELWPLYHHLSIIIVIWFINTRYFLFKNITTAAEKNIYLLMKNIENLL